MSEETLNFIDTYRLNLKEEPSKYYGRILTVGGFAIGSILLILSLVISSTGIASAVTSGAAILYDLALLGLLMMLGAFLQTEGMITRYKRILNPLLEMYREKRYRDLVLRGFLPIILVIYIILLALTLSGRINFLQQTIIAIVAAVNLIMVSVGLTLTTRVRKFSNFAQSEFLIVGIYVSVALGETVVNSIGSALHPVLAASEWFFFELIIAFILTGLVGVLAEIAIFGPLTKRNATPLSLMVSSIGLGLIIRQTLQEIFGSIPRTSAPDYPELFNSVGEGIQSLGSTPLVGWIFNILSTPFAESTKFEFFGSIIFRISRDETWSIVVCFITLGALQYIFTKTTLGISMRATADDSDLAQITGINTRRVIYWTWFIAAGVTGMGAIFFFEAAQIQPGSGFVQLLLIFAVVILGGFDSFEGTVISGFIISFSMSVAVILNGELAKLQQQNELFDKMVFWSTSGDWKFAVAFAIIIVVLIFRPRGIFGLVDPRSKL